MTEYPKVLGEFETLDLVLKGKSLSRLGDGELSGHVRGRKNVSQVHDPKLTREINAVLIDPPKNLLVGIPTMDPKGPKYQSNWRKYEAGYARFMNPKVQYGSAFISRPDSAPWIDTPEFFDKLESLWRGQKITLVSSGVKTFTPDQLREHDADVHHVECPYRDAYARIDRLEAACRDAGRRTILCAGPTATVLAARLARAKIHAIDLGHIFSFWRRYAKQ